MPELLTKYPDVVLQVLKGAKIRCGTDEAPKILTHCPKQNFCSLPTGELCIYGVKDISHMTQIQSWDVLLSSISIIPFLTLLFIVFILGMIVGVKIK